MYKAFIYCFMLMCFWVCSNAQSTEIDSLILVVNLQEDNQQKVDNLVKIGYEYHRIDIDSCFQYAQQVLAISNDLNYVKGKASGLWLKALVGYYKGDFENALDYGKESLAIAQSINEPLLILRAANTISVIYHLKAKHDHTIEYLLYAYKASVQLNDSLMMLQLLQNLGNVHLEEDNITEATKYYKQLTTFNIHQDSSPAYKTYLYFSKGVYHRLIGQHEESIRLYSKGLPIAKNENNIFSLAFLNEGLGLSYVNLQSYENAKYHYKEALSHYKAMGAQNQVVENLSHLTDIYYKNKEYELAIKSGTEGLEIADSLSVINHLSKLTISVANAHEKLNQIPQALQYHKAHKMWSDSLSSAAKHEAILKMESDYQFSLLEEEQEKNKAIIEQVKQRNFIYFLLLLLASIATLFYWINFKTKERYSKSLENEVADRIKDLKESNDELSIANSELERFAFISSHDLKEHLRNIGSFSSLLERESPELNSKIGKAGSYFDVIKKSTNSMYQLVEDTMQFVSIKKENLDQAVNLNDIINNIKKRKHSKSKIPIGRIESETLPTITANNQQIDLLFSEVIENGFKFNNNPNPLVKITYSETKSHHTINIIDNGIGLDEVYSNQAVTMFARLHNRSEYQGSGLGLAIVNKVINLLNGEVSIHKMDEGGTLVKLKLPKMDYSYNNVYPKQLALST